MKIWFLQCAFLLLSYVSLANPFKLPSLDSGRWFPVHFGLHELNTSLVVVKDVSSKGGRRLYIPF